MQLSLRPVSGVCCRAAKMVSWRNCSFRRTGSVGACRKQFRRRPAGFRWNLGEQISSRNWERRVIGPGPPAPHRDPTIVEDSFIAQAPVPSPEHAKAKPRHKISPTETHCRRGALKTLPARVGRQKIRTTRCWGNAMRAITDLDRGAEHLLRPQILHAMNPKRAAPETPARGGAGVCGDGRCIARGARACGWSRRQRDPHRQHHALQRPGRGLWRHRQGDRGLFRQGQRRGRHQRPQDQIHFV